MRQVWAMALMKRTLKLLEFHTRSVPAKPASQYALSASQTCCASKVDPEHSLLWFHHRRTLHLQSTRSIATTISRCKRFLWNFLAMNCTEEYGKTETFHLKAVFLSG